MKINEEFDDEVADDEIVEETPVVERPKGQFSRTMAGREIWFNPPVAGQFNAFRRYRETLANRYEKLRAKVIKSKDADGYSDLVDLSEKLDASTLEFFESLLADESDVDFIALEMIGGRILMNDILKVLFGEPEPEDDEAPAPKPRKAVKKVANAKRARK